MSAVRDLDRQHEVLEMFAEQAQWFRDTSAPYWFRIRRERAETRRLVRRQQDAQDRMLTKLHRMKHPRAAIAPLPRRHVCPGCGEAWGTRRGLLAHQSSHRTKH